MPIIINLDVMLAKRKCVPMNSPIEWELPPRQSINFKTEAIRFSTLELICEILECQPGDILSLKGRIILISLLRWKASRKGNTIFVEVVQRPEEARGGYNKKCFL
jgi:putative transcriptional regulator